jgi:hypothetical protein
LAVPVPPDWSASETITEAKLDSISTVLNFILNYPCAYAYKTADGALAHATWDAINFGAESYDSHNAHDNSTNNTRLIFPENGVYELKAHGAWDTNANGIRGLNIRKGAGGVQTAGTDVITDVIAGNGTTQARLSLSIDQQFIAGEYVELFAYQGSGGPLNVLGGIANTFLSFRFVRKTV